MNFDTVRIDDHLMLRHMTENDLAEVLKIEGASFDSPWTRNNFLDEFKNPDIALPLVLELDSVIVGFTVLWIILDECHMANVAIYPDFRGRGYAKAIIKQIIKLSQDKACAKIMLEVRESNKAAIDLYRKFHFVQVGVRKDYYHDGFVNNEDALLMDLDISAKD